jgi:hypothetical protein
MWNSNLISRRLKIAQRFNAGEVKVDRVFRRAMLNLLGFADIVSIEQGTARSTGANGVRSPEERKGF